MNMNIALPYLYYAFYIIRKFIRDDRQVCGDFIYTRVIISVIDISNGYPVTDNKQTRK